MQICRMSNRETIERNVNKAVGQMESNYRYHFSYIFLCIFFIQGLIFAQTVSQTPENELKKTAESESNLIHLGDLIDVDVIGSLEYDWRGTLNPEGFLDGIHFVENSVYALCQSEEDVADAVAKAYGKILREPKVVVKILDRSKRPFSVLDGAVKTPQRFQISRSVALNELIIVSGGFTDKVSGEIQIFRPQNLNCLAKITEKPQPSDETALTQEKYVPARQDNGSQYINIKISDLLKGKAEANPQILSGDIITVLEAQPIYVIGGVANPKQISTRSQMTLSRAIASAGGVTKDGDGKRITIFRRAGNETKIIEADLEKLKTDQTADIILQAFDIVEVAQTGRDKKKFPPVIKIADTAEKNSANLPLRIID